MNVTAFAKWTGTLCDGAENVGVEPNGKIVVSRFANGTRTGYGLVRILP